MDSGAGRVWLDRGGEPKARWMTDAGIPEFPERAVLQANDCVLCIGEGAVGRRGGRSDRALLAISPSFRIGSRASAAISPWLMNRSADLFALLKNEEIERRLLREGLAADFGSGLSAGQASSSRRYTVTVFDLAVVDMQRVYSRSKLINGVNYISENMQNQLIDDRLRNIIAKAAVRALYIVGLDFGQVDLELDDWGRATIVAVHTRMSPSKGEGEKTLAEAVAGFAATWMAEMLGRVNVTLGADPEFIMLAPDGKVVPASRYFPRDGDAGCDSVVIRGVRRWPLAELRPAPATEPAAVAADVRRLLTAAARRTAGAKLAWRAGAGPVRGLPLGGHVHISGAALTGERLRALDNAVALPLRLLEPPSAAARRPRFGALGDFRRQSHGGFEYRTPPSWLVSPRLACGALALAKVAAEHARELAAHRPLDEDYVRDAFYAGDRDVLLAGMAKVRAVLASTSGYLKYESLIAPLFDAIDRNRTWNETTDLRERWGITVT
ncbi:putative amidoligase domain-containing protein [Cohnella yongneupensis]|uniref:PhiEco32-like amidoligase-type 2 protein n=1 Tax=Cohnella yongneupensis TaxID=425006 RepID=A0ABW0R7Q6_9BACL